MISEATKLALNDLLKNFDPIILKSDDDIGQTGLIEMHIATRLNVTPIVACPYPLELKHHDFLKQEIKNLFNVGINHRSMSPWASPIVVVKKHTEGSPQQFSLCVNYRELNSLLPTSTLATGTKKGNLGLMPLPKIDKLFALLKGAKYITALG